MVKKILIAILLISGTCHGQVKYTILSEKKIGSVHYSYNKMINLQRGDTSFYISILFKNEKYEYIDDYKIIDLNDYSEMLDFTKDFNDAFQEISNKDEIIWSKEKYIISPNKFHNIILMTKDGGYTTLSKGQSKKLIDWLNSLQI